MAILVLAHVAAADTGVHRIVVEAYEGERPADANAALAPVYTELGKRGYALGHELAQHIDHAVSRNAGTLSASQLVDAQKQVDDAYQRLIDGDYPVALQHARDALKVYDSAPGQLAQEAPLRDQRYRALVVAARSSEVKGNAEDAFSAMAEAIRSFPDRPVSNAQFDPSVSALYRRVKDELARQGLGTLEVKVDDPTVAVFVDEQFAGSGGAKLGPIAPGRYRVYISKAKLPGRVHEIDVAPGSSQTIELSWAVDAVLHTEDGVVALDLEPTARPEDEVPSAILVARSVGAETVIVLSVRKINGRRSVAGYSIKVESQTRAFAGVQIEPVQPSDDTLAKLAALLDGDHNVGAPGLFTTETSDEPSGPSSFTSRRKVALGVGVIGVGAVAAGVVLGLQANARERDAAALCPTDMCAQADAANALLERGQSRAKLANIGFGVGAAAIIGGAVLWFTGHSNPSAEHLAVVPQVSDGYAGLTVVTGF